jgi:hypothetical protein
LDNIKENITNYFQKEIGDQIKESIEKYGIKFEKFNYYMPND